jgi:hypothetical protein
VTLFISPITRALDASGNPLAGAKLYFYRSGTTTAVPVYTTAARTTAHASPVVADSGGLFAPIYLGPAAPCRVVLKTSAGTTIQDVDPYDGPSQSRLGFSPEQFGAAGDGTTDDTAAFGALAAAVNAAGGGVIDLYPGATYLVAGGANQTLQNPPLYTYYTFPPTQLYVMELASCGSVVIRGNGARIRNAGGGRYGTFNTNGTPMSVSNGYVGVGASTPYYSMLHVHGCGAVEIENLELDGNILDTTIGGPFSDTGIQLPMSGLVIEDCAGPVRIANVHSHHHGLDGIQVNGPALDDGSSMEHGIVEGCRFEHNGRQGCSFVGGRGWSFRRCSFSHTGKDTHGVTSNPGAGIDFEAEGDKAVRDVVLSGCELVDNYGCAIVADSGTDVDRVTIESSLIVGTTNYSLWLNRPGFRLDGCVIVGTMVFLWPGTSPFNPHDAVHMRQCRISNDPALSPTGAVFQVNNLLLEGGLAFIEFDHCLFEHDRSGYGSNGNLDQARLVSCTVIARQGTVTVYGRFAGRTHFVEAGGTVAGVPNTPLVIVGRNDAGEAEDPWFFTTGGVTTRYPATLDPATGTKVLGASAAYDPPSIAAGAQASTTVTVANAAPGDFVQASFSLDLQGTELAAGVSAANTVTVLFKNGTGGTVDLASGTITVRGYKKP